MAGDLGMRLGLYLKEDLYDPLEMGAQSEERLWWVVGC